MVEAKIIKNYTFSKEKIKHKYKKCDVICSSPVFELDESMSIYSDDIYKSILYDVCLTFNFLAIELILIRDDVLVEDGTPDDLIMPIIYFSRTMVPFNETSFIPRKWAIIQSTKNLKSLSGHQYLEYAHSVLQSLGIIVCWDKETENKDNCSLYDLEVW